MGTPTGTSFTWILWPPGGNHSIAFDEFIAEGFRIQLRGDSLELSWEAPGVCAPGSASALGERYVEALGKHLVQRPILMTEEDWSTRTSTPFAQIVTVSTTLEDRNRAARAVRDARNELLAGADAILRRCYNHLQDALEHDAEATHQTAVSVYKAMEELEQRFGAKAKAAAELGKQFKDVKRAANEQRHIASKQKPMPNPPPSLVGSAKDVIREYERYLLRER